MNAYVPIIVLGAIAAAFAVFSVFIASAVGPSRYNRAKLEPYECGIEPVGVPAESNSATTTAARRNTPPRH